MMLNEDDDPLSGSFFDINPSSSFLGQPPSNGRPSLQASFYASQYDEDPWSSIGQGAQQPSIGHTISPPTSPTMTHTRQNNNGIHTGRQGSGLIQSTPRLDSGSSTLAQVTLANVFNDVQLPEIYSTAFSEVQRSGKVPLDALRRLLESSPSYTDQIIRIVTSNGTSVVGQAEFNAALGLLACAQNRMDVSLMTLYQNRHFLAEPVVHLTRHDHATRSDPLKQHAQERVSSPLSGGESPKINGSYPGMNSKAAESPSRQRDSRQPAAKSAKMTKSLDTQNWFQHVEEIKVTIAPEREGFIFKHVNYIVESQKRSSIVLRRFSDFWWLMEVLLRRYPFRILPNLPPKKVGGRDAAFLEKRRKGLSRFINAIVRHPTLRSDEVVTKFLTEPLELMAWRKQHPPSLEEEYRRKPRSIEDLQSMIPSDLDERLRKTEHLVNAAIEHYITMCFIMERMIRRMHGQANDYARYSLALNALAEAEHRYHVQDCRPCQQVTRGSESVAKHMQRESSILDSQVSAAADGVLENLKRLRDLLVSFRELEERKEKLAGNQVDSLTKKIATNRTKVNQQKGVPGMEAEVARLEELIRSDERELQDQKCRQVFIQFCMWSELNYLHKQNAFVSTLYQGFVRDMLQFSKRHVDNWTELETFVLEMPIEPNEFA